MKHKRIIGCICVSPTFSIESIFSGLVGWAGVVAIGLEPPGEEAASSAAPGDR